MVSDDFKAHIFNESLILVKTINMQSRLIQHIELVEQVNERGETTDTLVAAGIYGVLLYDFKYLGATDIKQQHKLDPLGLRLKFSLRLCDRLRGVAKWLKGI